MVQFLQWIKTMDFAHDVFSLEFAVQKEKMIPGDTDESQKPSTH
jgi:hypothetical protein